MNKGQKLLTSAKKIIPGGNQLLSKRSEMFLPGLWPNYYKKAKGCKIWDLENKMYYDFAGMGVTACVLGYSDRDVNKALFKVSQKESFKMNFNIHQRNHNSLVAYHNDIE